MRRFVYILTLLLLPLLVNAQDVKVRSWFDTTRILIGDHVNYNVEIEHPGDLNISYPSLSDTLAKGIEILSVQPPDTLNSKDEIRVKFKYLVTSFDTGFYEIKPVFAESKTATGVQRYFSDYTSLEVLRTGIAPQDSTRQFFDIAGPRKARVTVMEVLPWILMLIALVLAGIFIYRFFGKRKQQKPEEESFLPKEPIHIIALRELDKLEKKGLWQKAQQKKHFSELTGILRSYIDRRYSISSMEMTSSETLEALLKTGFDNGGLFKLLKDLFTTADLTKFAKYRPDDAVSISAVKDARVFVKQTCIKNKEGEEVNNE